MKQQARSAAATTLAVMAALMLGLAPLAQAESFASSASSAGSASVGSLSDSVQGSSGASSPDGKPTAGLYRIEQIAQADKPGLLRVALAHDDGRAFFLLLPQTTAEQQQLSAGQMLRVSEQTYGLAFARAERREPFFLALADAVRSELAPRPVTSM
jgi:hypothetical protein